MVHIALMFCGWSPGNEYTYYGVCLEDETHLVFRDSVLVETGTVIEVSKEGWYNEVY